MITASDLRHSITITLETKIGTGARGQDEYVTKTLGQVMAKIEPLAGRKLEIARQLVPTASHEVTIRYLQGVTPDCQVHFGTRLFNIGNVNNKLENNFEMCLLCSEAQ